MKILVTNDDGVHAPGLEALARSLRRLGEVTVVAPAAEMSASAHSLTLTRPLRMKRIAAGVFSVDGTPTDCVYLAIYHVLGGRADLVVSGVNAGWNLGDDITYSGTVAAALEGTLLGCPSFAVSQERSRPMRYGRSAAFARDLARRILDHGLPKDVYLNVNVPSRRIRGVAFVRQGKRIYHDGVSVVRRKGESPRYRIGGWPEWEEQPGSDIAAFRAGHVTITPLRVDLTDDAAIRRLSRWRLPVPGRPGGETARPAAARARRR